VSEYQYYDFRAMDRALTRAEVAELRSISTRAIITSTGFTNHYEWGDLKANPLKLLSRGLGGNPAPEGSDTSCHFSAHAKGIFQQLRLATWLTSGLQTIQTEP
jgi:hypothetical protein